jgi:hypothetical protein
MNISIQTLPIWTSPPTESIELLNSRIFFLKKIWTLLPSWELKFHYQDSSQLIYNWLATWKLLKAKNLVLALFFLDKKVPVLCQVVEGTCGLGIFSFCRLSTGESCGPLGLWASGPVGLWHLQSRRPILSEVQSWSPPRPSYRCPRWTAQGTFH